MSFCFGTVILLAKAIIFAAIALKTKQTFKDYTISFAGSSARTRTYGSKKRILQACKPATIRYDNLKLKTSNSKPAVRNFS
jgi:uncharacterized lipoprotein YehR (DUF1307 family)